jgi:Xaa-Pro aminopeptidase
MSFEKDSPYYIDYPERIRKVQAGMAEAHLDAYLGSRLRTMSWTTDAFLPWRSFILIPAEGMPTLFTFVIDAARAADESWLDEDHVMGFAPMGGMDQISLISGMIADLLPEGGRLGVEAGMSNYLPEGYLTYYEYNAFKDALPDVEFVNAHYILDNLQMIKEPGVINRFREASRIVDIGQEAVLEAIRDGGWKGMTETEIAGIGAYAMRKAGSTWEWSFTGGNEIATGYRSGFAGGACTPATTKEIKSGDALTVDLHALFGLACGDHTHNYLIGDVTDRAKWHAKNFVDIVDLTLKTYKAGVTPSSLAEEMMAFAEERGFSDFMVPGFEHGIGMLGDEWRIGKHDGPMPYWTDPDHVYQENEVLICAIQYACPEEKIGFRYENPILINKDDCEFMSKFPLAVEVIE